MGTGQGCMYARLYATQREHRLLTWSLSRNGQRHNCELDPRTPAATRDSDALDYVPFAASASVDTTSPSSDSDCDGNDNLKTRAGHCL